MKKIIYSIFLIFSVIIFNGCKHQVAIDDTPKDLTESDFAKIDKVALLNSKQQNSIMKLSEADMNYAIKYFPHFVEVMSLANANAVSVKIDSLEKIDVNSAKNKSFMEFVNLLSYYKINVIYEFDLEMILKDFKLNMNHEEEQEYLEELKEELFILTEFLDSFDDKSKIATLCFNINLPTISGLQKNIQKNNLLSIVGNNAYGFEKDNEFAYKSALEKLKFARKFFGLEQLIWKIDLDEVTLGLAEKLLDRKRLDFEILTAVDMVIYSIDFAQAESYRERMLKNGNISKSVVVEWKLKQDYKWDNFIKDWTDFTGKSTDFTAFGGIMLDTYGRFYQIWRVEVNGEK